MTNDCICSNVPRIWRLAGVTRTVRLTVTKDGSPYDFTGLQTVLRIDRDNSDFHYEPQFTVEGDDNNIIVFTWAADKQPLGDYTIEVAVTDGSGNMDRVNWHGATGVRLVEYSNLVKGEDAAGVESDSELGLDGIFTMNGTGMSAFDEWLASDESQGYPQTMDGYMQWQQHAATEAAAEVLAELGSRDGSAAGDGTMWGDYKSAEAQRNTDYGTAEEHRDGEYATAEAARDTRYGTAEGTSGSAAGNGSRWGAYKTAENSRDGEYSSAEGHRDSEYSSAEGHRDGEYATAEAARDTLYGQAEGTASSAAGSNNRWGSYKTAEAARNTARETAEGTAASSAGDGTRWGAYKTAEAARNTARENAEGTASSTAGDGTRWGAYKTAEAARGTAYGTAEGSSSSTAGDGSRWGAYKTAEAARSEQLNDLEAEVNQLGQDVDEDCTVDAKRFIVNEEQHIPYSIANGETVIVRVVKAAGANTSVYARTAINVATGQIQLRSLMYADEAEVTANRSFKYLFFTGENISNGAVVDIIRKGKLWQNVKDNMDLTRYQNPSYPCFVARESNHNDQGCAVFQIYQSDGVQGFFSWVYKAFRYLKLTGFDSTKQYCVTMFRAGYGASNTDFQIRFKELANGSLSNEVSFSIAASSIKVVGGVNRIVATSGNYSLEAIVDYSCVPLYSTINLTVTRFVVAPECFEPTTAALASEVENLNAASLKKSDLGLSIISDNIANPDDIQTDMYVRSDGVVDKQTGWAITSVPVIAGQKVTFGGCKLGRTGYYRFQDANGGKVSSGQYDDPNYRVNPITLDVPATAVLLFIDIASSSSPSDPYSGLQVNLGDTFLPYDEFEKVITSINNEPLAGGASKALEERIENIEDSLATIQEEIGLGMASVIADLPVSDGTDIEVGYAYIDSSSSVVKVKMS